MLQTDLIPPAPQYFIGTRTLWKHFYVFFLVCDETEYNFHLQSQPCLLDFVRDYESLRSLEIFNHHYWDFEAKKQFLPLVVYCWFIHVFSSPFPQRPVYYRCSIYFHINTLLQEKYIFIKVKWDVQVRIKYKLNNLLFNSAWFSSIDIWISIKAKAYIKINFNKLESCHVCPMIVYIWKFRLLYWALSHETKTFADCLSILSCI